MEGEGWSSHAQRARVQWYALQVNKITQERRHTLSVALAIQPKSENAKHQKAKRQKLGCVHKTDATLCLLNYYITETHGATYRTCNQKSWTTRFRAWHSND
jgi:hypothetical protein